MDLCRNRLEPACWIAPDAFPKAVQCDRVFLGWPKLSPNAPIVPDFKGRLKPDEAAKTASRRTERVLPEKTHPIGDAWAVRNAMADAALPVVNFDLPAMQASQACMAVMT